jgi:hypothetical protein
VENRCVSLYKNGYHPWRRDELINTGKDLIACPVLTQIRGREFSDSDN